MGKHFYINFLGRYVSWRIDILGSKPFRRTGLDHPAKTPIAMMGEGADIIGILV
jgi:hypothetical protein